MSNTKSIEELKRSANLAGLFVLVAPDSFKLFRRVPVNRLVLIKHCACLDSLDKAIKKASNTK